MSYKTTVVNVAFKISSESEDHDELVQKIREVLHKRICHSELRWDWKGDDNKLLDYIDIVVL